MKKNLLKKLIISCLTLVFALVATASTTYAWFTVNGTVAVSGLDMTVKSEDGIFAAVYNGDTQVSGWSKAADISSFFGADLTDKMNAVTSKDGIKFYSLNDVESVNEGPDKFTYTEVQSTSKANNYVEFVLYFATSADKISVTLTDTTAPTRSGEGSVSNSIEDVLRTSVQVNSDTTATIYRFSASSLQSTDAALANYNNAFSTDVDAAGKTANLTDTFYKTDYNFENCAQITTLELTTSSTFTLPSDLTAINSMKYVKTTWRIWVEGNSYECLNAIFSQQYKTTLTFAPKAA